MFGINPDVQANLDLELVEPSKLARLKRGELVPHQMAVRKLLSITSQFKEKPTKTYLRYKFARLLHREEKGRLRAMRGSYVKNKPSCGYRSPAPNRWNKNRNPCWSKRKPSY